MSIILKTASNSDAPALRGLLQQANLPIDDLPADLAGFTLAFDGALLVGSAGMEILGNTGLLRSLAVAETHRNHQIGQQLFTSAIAYASAQKAETIFLITNTAERYFEKNGFHTIERDQTPAEITQTAQFSGLCPSNAAVMKMELDQS